MKTVSAVLATLAMGAGFAACAFPRHAAESSANGVITTNQEITPAGIQSVFDGQARGVAFGPSPDEIYAAVKTETGGVVLDIDWRQNRVIQRIESSAAPGNQGVAIDASGHLLFSAVGGETRRLAKTGSAANGDALASTKNGALIRLLRLDAGGAEAVTDALGADTAGGVATAGDCAVVALTFDNELAVIDLAQGKLRGKVRTGVAPFNAAISADASVAYVSNFGGRFPHPADRVAPTGYDHKQEPVNHREVADRVVVDQRGIAASGTVARVDLRTLTVTDTIPVGLHPTSLAWDEAGHRLYVSNSNSDTVAVIATDTNRLAATIPLQFFDRAVPGIAPEALVLSRDGRRLFVACAGINAVAVFDVDPAADARFSGLIPTGWYPCHLALSSDGQHLAILTLLGIGTGWNTSSVARIITRDGLRAEPGMNRRSAFAYRGTVQVVSVPDAVQLARYTLAVAHNNHLPPPSRGLAAAPPAASQKARPVPVPLRTGEPSLIQHVVFIIKENRSYDQIMGGLGKGNGDPALQHWGDDVAPNQRALARQFVLLDNFYATGSVSANGHQWLTQAQETDYTHWPVYPGRSYPFDGSDPLAYASSGFIWDAVVAAHRTFQDFGEFAGLNGLKYTARSKYLAMYHQGFDFAGEFHVVAPIAPLQRYLAADFPTYGGQVPDVARARIFLHHLAQWETAGNMPNLVMVHLPSDHTWGTTPGFSTPSACVADNDLALGQIVEGLSHSRFWPSMLIIAVEDDAYDGIDHVDGHRTVALAASPYIRRGAIDSTFYSHPSILKTIELILGVPNLTIFDLIANDMRNAFQDQPDLTPYTAIVPRQSLDEVNPPAAALRGPARTAAIASARMNFIVPDVAPEAELNAILWHTAKGWNAALPPSAHAAFAPYAATRDGDDDDDD